MMGEPLGEVDRSLCSLKFWMFAEAPNPERKSLLTVPSLPGSFFSFFINCKTKGTCAPRNVELFQKALKIQRLEEKPLLWPQGCVAAARVSVTCERSSNPCIRRSSLHRVLVHSGDVGHRDGVLLVAGFRKRGRFQHGGVLPGLLPLLPLLFLLLLVQHVVVDAHPDEQEDARDDEDDAAGQVGVVVAVVVVVEGTCRRRREVETGSVEVRFLFRAKA